MEEPKVALIDMWIAMAVVGALMLIVKVLL